MRLIVNADDLGISRHVNESIFALMTAGQVTSATVLMNGPAVAEAAEAIHHHPRASFGVHLNLTEFAPLTGSSGLRPLLDEEGRFVRLPHRIPATSALREAIYAEWCAQVLLARTLGIQVSHLDSHHHIHTQPALFQVLKRVQRTFGIRKVRVTWNLYGPTEKVRPPLLMAKQVWNLCLRHCYSTVTTRCFTPFATLHERLLAGLHWHGDLEAMCHPGNPLFEEETKLLSGGWQQDLQGRARLISYHDL